MIDLDVQQPELVELDSGFLAEVGGGAAKWITQKTKEEWAADTGTVSEKGHIYVITDYETDEDGTIHPGLKIGDGKAYIGDLPVVAGSQIKKDTASTVSAADRSKWNSAVAAQVDDDTETLVLQSVAVETTTENTGE